MQENTNQLKTVEMQFANAKRLTQIIIRSGIQRGDFVALFAACGKHNHRHRAPLAQVADKLNPITIGQAEIENNQIWLTGCRFQQAALQRFGLKDAHPVALQRRAQKATNSLFIFNNQNVCHISS